MTDQQTKPRWPWAGDTELQKARRLANSALTMLAKVDPESAELLVDQAHLYGESWLGPGLVINSLEDALTTVEAAQLLHVKPGTIRKWACTEHPDPVKAAAGEMVLRRFTMRGRDRTYLVKDVYEANRLMSETRAERVNSEAA